MAVGALFVGLFSLRDNNTSGGSAAGEGGGGGATSVTVTVTEFKFSPNSLSISTEGGTIKIVNSGTAAHNLSIPQLGLKSEDVQPGATGELKVGKNAAGSYEVLCEIPGHADSGMTGTISVGGSGGGEAVAAGTDTGAHAVDGATMTPAQNAAMDARMLAVAQAYPAKTEGIGGKILEPTIETIDGHETKVYDLEAKIVDWEVSPGKKVKAWTYNGVVPGPELVWKKGDFIQINFTNNLPQSTSIHFHGIRVPNQMDGVDPYTQPPTEPGGTSLTTRALAPTFDPSPMVIGPMILAPAPSSTPLPMVGCRLNRPRERPPRVTWWYISTSSPISAVSPITTPLP